MPLTIIDGLMHVLDNNPAAAIQHIPQPGHQIAFRQILYQRSVFRKRTMSAFYSHIISSGGIAQYERHILTMQSRQCPLHKPFNPLFRNVFLQCHGRLLLQCLQHSGPPWTHSVCCSSLRSFCLKFSVKLHILSIRTYLNSVHKDHRNPSPADFRPCTTPLIRHKKVHCHSAMHAKIIICSWLPC